MLKDSRRLFGFCAFLIFVSVTSASADTMTLAWNANPESDVAGYRLFYGVQAGSHPTKVEVGNQTSVPLNGLVDGQRYYFVVRAYNTSGLESPDSTEVSGVAIGLVGITSTASSDPIPTGAPVTWTALAGANATLEYQFWRLNQASGVWSMVQNYGPQNSFTWTPSASELGTYVIQVWARATGSTANLETWRTTGAFTIADSPITIGSIESSVALPAPTGSPITWKARATGGPAPLQYRFYRLNQQTGVWTLARDYSTVDNFSWTPASGDLGTHLIQVWVRSAGSGATYDQWRSSESFEINNGPPAVASVTTTTPLPAGTGTPITWKAVASGGPGPLEYKFYRWSAATGAWTVVQNFGSSNSYTWTPTSGQQGTYQLQAWVRKVGSSAAYEGWAGTPQFQIQDAVPVVRGISSDAGPSMGTGAMVTWTADATGGPGPLQYRFWLYNVTRDTWSMVRDYSASNTFSWAPGAWDAGAYTLQVWVRRPGSSANFDAWSATAFTVSASAPTIAAITNSVGAAGTVGMPITWTAKPAGGQGPLEYRFIRFNAATQVWTVVQDYSWDNTYSWVPKMGEQGSYGLQVWVRRSGSAATYEGWAAASTLIVN